MNILQDDEISDFDEFQKTTRIIVRAFIRNEAYIANDHIHSIITSLRSLTMIMRNDKPKHFQHFEDRLLNAIRLANLNNIEKWLYLSFRDLVVKITERKIIQDWISVGSIFNCVHLIRTVAEKNIPDSAYTERLQTWMENGLVHLLVNEFSDFIVETGGWIDINDYVMTVENYNNTMPSINWSIYLIPIFIIIVTNLMIYVSQF